MIRVYILLTVLFSLTSMPGNCSSDASITTISSSGDSHGFDQQKKRTVKVGWRDALTFKIDVRRPGDTLSYDRVSGPVDKVWFLIVLCDCLNLDFIHGVGIRCGINNPINVPTILHNIAYIG
jgi:hypothetical protein